MKFELTAALWLLPILAAGATEHTAPLPAGELSHIHGVVLPAGSDDVLLATHFGLYAVDRTGMAIMISAAADDFMGFTSGTDGRLYASGHPGTGGNTGVIGTSGAGADWSHLSDGIGGPVDFHSMTVSPADPDTLYGSYGGVQVSRDGGRTWALAGSGPSELIDLAAAADEPGHVYAATMTGLQQSVDFGKTWSPVAEGAPVTAVEVASDGGLHAFVPGTGFLALNDTSELVPVGEIKDTVVLHMAFDPDDQEHLVAVTAESQVISSMNGGRSWSSFAP